jgi:hypothetical protein
MKKFTLVLSPILCFVLLLTPPALPTGTMIAFRHCPHACNNSKCAQIEWHFRPASSADSVGVECNYEPRNSSGKWGIANPQLTRHLNLGFAQIQSHTAARCPPGLYGDLHKCYCFSFSHSCTGALRPLRGLGAAGIQATSFLHRPVLLLFHHFRE